MEIQITNIKKKDYKKAIQFAKTGMHFDLYLDNKFLLYLYGNYFWYDELNRATQVIAAYVGEELQEYCWRTSREKRNHTGLLEKQCISKYSIYYKNCFIRAVQVFTIPQTKCYFVNIENAIVLTVRLYFLPQILPSNRRESAANYWKNWSVVKKENRSTYIPMMLVPTNFMNAEGFSGQERKKWCWILAVKKYL